MRLFAISMIITLYKEQDINALSEDIFTSLLKISYMYSVVLLKFLLENGRGLPLQPIKGAALCSSCSV